MPANLKTSLRTPVASSLSPWIPQGLPSESMARDSSPGRPEPRRGLRLGWALAIAVVCLPLMGAAPKSKPGAPANPKREAAKASGLPALVSALTPMLRDAAVRGGRVSILVETLDGGKTLYARGANQRLHPASNTKLVTTAAALTQLGPNFRFTTDLVATGLKEGVAETLYLVGGGDPRFVSESLWKLVEDAHLWGLRSVSGDLVVDESIFTPRHNAPGYDRSKDDAAYRAPSSGMTFNFNSVSLSIRPGAKAGVPPVVKVVPDTGYVILENNATTVSRGRERLQVRADPHKDRTRIRIRGRIPLKHRGLKTRRRIDNPPLYAGLAARHQLEKSGITVGGRVRVGRAPAQHTRIARHTSPALASLVADVNKLSNNVMAEQVLRTLGAVTHGVGSWEKGRAVVQRFLKSEVGLEGFAYANGSGLFGDTAFSARDLVSLLRFMAQRRPALPEYAASLAIGGHDGTLRRRLRRLEPGRLRGKTGTLNGVVCLSGYTYLADHTPVVFSMLMNDVPGRPWSVWRVQDRMLDAIVKFRMPKSQKGRARRR